MPGAFGAFGAFAQKNANARAFGAFFTNALEMPGIFGKNPANASNARAFRHFAVHFLPKCLKCPGI